MYVCKQVNVLSPLPHSHSPLPLTPLPPPPSVSLSSPQSFFLPLTHLNLSSSLTLAPLTHSPPLTHTPPYSHSLSLTHSYFLPPPPSTSLPIAEVTLLEKWKC